MSKVDPIGQEAIKALLVEMAKNGRLPHALLFCGQEGVGALALTWFLARWLLCTQRQDNMACGVCPACYKSLRLIHPDLHFSFPMNKPRNNNSVKNLICSEVYPQWRDFLLNNPFLSEADWYRHLEIDNKQGLISTAEAEDIIRTLSLKPFEADIKILIMWLPERLHPTAANKLLKLIEEPPSGTFFFLVSEHPHLVLQTIRSRCLSLWVPPIEPQALAQALIEHQDLDSQQAGLFSRLSGGSYSVALKLIEQENGDTRFGTLFDDLVGCCIQKKYNSLLEWADSLAEMDKESQKSFILFCLQMLREYLMLSLKQDNLVYLHSSALSTARERILRFPATFFPLATDLCNGVMTDLERNVNPKLIFTTFAFDFNHYLCAE